MGKPVSDRARQWSGPSDGSVLGLAITSSICLGTNTQIIAACSLNLANTPGLTPFAHSPTRWDGE